MSLELMGAIIAVVAAYIIGRMGGRAAEVRERDGRGGGLGSGLDKRGRQDARETPAPVRGVQAQRDLTPEVVQTLGTHIKAGRTLQAIKLYREITGLGLKESKDAVEALKHRLKL